MFLRRRLKPAEKSDTAPAAERSRAMPTSRLVMVTPSWRYHETVPDAAHRLQEQRIGGVALDLAAQAIDLDVDGALAGGGAVAGEREARHRLARARGEHAQHLAFAVGEMDDLLALAQLAARDVEHERAE